MCVNGRQEGTETQDFLLLLRGIQGKMKMSVRQEGKEVSYEAEGRDGEVMEEAACYRRWWYKVQRRKPTMDSVPQSEKERQQESPDH